ncbi:hypothetical protein JCM33374_g3061 [Metschnikowia sp. JCM 33374]|nr:hypothetical protein JCM33374_g3061 [Metschnikowia sp. JCM 33374]
MIILVKVVNVVNEIVQKGVRIGAVAERTSTTGVLAPSVPVTDVVEVSDLPHVDVSVVALEVGIAVMVVAILSLPIGVVVEVSELSQVEVGVRVVNVGSSTKGGIIVFSNHSSRGLRLTPGGSLETNH